MRTSTLRKRAFTLAAAVAVMAPAAIGLVAPSANAASVTPVKVDGNPNCTSLDPAYDYGFKPGKMVDGKRVENAPDTYTDPVSGRVVTFTGGMPEVGWESDIAPEAVIVKGGNGANVYIYNGNVRTDSGLVSPINNSGKPANLSHIEFCYNYNVTATKTAKTSFDRDWSWGSRRPPR